MKVYELFTNTPQIKIQNEQLRKAGFIPGQEFEIQYNYNQIILTVKEQPLNEKKMLEKDFNIYYKQNLARL